jgi:hypothetical protein
MRGRKKDKAERTRKMIGDRNRKKQWKMTKDKIERKGASKDEEEIEQKGRGMTGRGRNSAEKRKHEGRRKGMCLKGRKHETMRNIIGNKRM